MMRIFVLALVVTGACSEPPPEPPPDEGRRMCRERPLGDLAAAPELMVVRHAGDHLIDAAAQPAPRIDLGQGARGLSLSVRARNLDGCEIGLLVTANGQRAGALVELHPDDDGWGEAALDDPLAFVPLPAEPGPLALTAAIEDRDGRGALARLTIAVE